MPTVPRYSRQVSPQPLPSGALRAVDTPTSAGVGAAQARAQIGRGVAELGGAIADVGQKFLSISYSQRAKELQESVDYANQLAVLGADNKLANWERQAIHAPDTGALAQHGEAAFHLPETIDQDFKKTADEIEFGLTNPEQKLAFARIRNQRGQAVALTIARHVDSEMQQFAITELKAKRENSADAAIVYGGAMDFQRAGDEMQSYEQYLRLVGPKLGMPKDAIDAEVRSFRSGAHVAIIEQLLADEKGTTAKLYYDETKDQIAGDVRDNITKALSVGSTKADAQAASDKIMREGGTLTEQRDKAKAIADPEVRDATLTYIEHEALVKDRVQRDAEEARDKSVYNILDSGRGIRAIPSPIWSSMSGGERSAARSYAEHLADYGQNAVKTKAEVLADLITLSTTPELRDTWLKTNLLKYKLDLSPGDLEQMLRKQGSDREGKATPEIFATEGLQNEIIDAGLRQMGIDPSAAGLKKAGATERVAMFRRAVREAVDREYPPTDGKKPGRAEVQSIVDTLTAEVSTRRTGMFTSKPAYAFEVAQAQVSRIDQVPVAERRKIENAYRTDNRPAPTDQQIIVLFNQHLQRVRKDR